MKVTEEQKKTIGEKYAEYRALGMPKQEARRRIAELTGLGMTTVWDHSFHIDHESDAAQRPLETGWPKTYIITGWELRVRTDEKFVACLERMAELYDAELILVPCQKSDARYLPDALRSRFHVATESITFNNNLTLRYVETNALAVSPIAGHVGAYPDSTSIIPGLVKELRTEPSQHYVKQVISTGSVGRLEATLADYPAVEEEREFLRKWRTVHTRRQSRPVAIAQNYVVPSALVVDVLDERTFLTRFVSSHRAGVVYDLNKKFTPEGWEESAPLALVTGDFHAWEVDEAAYGATREMIKYLNPREVILNDFFDGASVNHHEVGSAVAFADAPSIDEEAELSRSCLEELCEISNQVTYLQSNHDNFLFKFLDKSESLWRLNRNYRTACELQLFRATSRTHPIVNLLRMPDFGNLRFITEKQNHYVGRVLVKHGHEGVSGVRAGFQALARIYNFYAQGHTHQPAVFRNAVCVGLNAKLDMDYTIGASAQMHANAVIQPDSSQQLLCIIRGNWIK